ncbi:J domain-containing protein [Bacteroides acidifaciens]|uniref:J domain-containing protein n=1 Tax=Bacteroides acidifaciens TaxID=85831 RepID=UPI002557DC96|nr:J domain-containing protein [Bacteroides acidifaciens]
MKNYYQILGLEEGATLDEIKAAYREYVVKFHPDKHNGDTFFKERFQEVQEAYTFFKEKFNNKEPQDTEYELNPEIIFSCNLTEVSKGEILAFDWFIQCDVFHTVTLNLDNGNNQCLFDSLPSHGHKEIKINSLNNDLLATICCNIENTTFRRSIIIKKKNVTADTSIKQPDNFKGQYWYIVGVVVLFIIILSNITKPQNRVDNNSYIIDSIRIVDSIANVLALEINSANDNGCIFEHIIREATFYHYHNEHFNYSISYPSFLIQGEESSNGCRFSMNDDIYLVVSGISNIYNESIENKYKQYDTKYITYSRLNKNWFVLSGYTSNGSIYYQKTVLHNDAFITATLCFPTKYKNEFDLIIKRIFSKFPN